MINDDLQSIIMQKMAFRPTNDQLLAIESFAEFALSRQPDSLFLLSGYAGTGKTTLVGAIVKTMLQLHQQVVLLAPTGRAAKVFSMHANNPAYTIHRRIYRETMGVSISASESGDTFARNDSSFSLCPPQLNRSTLFIVDEASMIANEGLSGGMFGTGRLLDDLIHYVYQGQDCRLMLVGDTAQLPPVGEELSPALDELALSGYGLNVTSCELTEVVRQTESSGILWNATFLRQIIQNDIFGEVPDLRVTGFPDVCVVPGNELIEQLENSYYHAGTDGTIVITRSNKRANIFNMGIRGRILGYDEELSSGDQVIVAKNNYFWVKEQAQSPQPPKGGDGFQSSSFSHLSPPLGGGGSRTMPFIANGDVAVVRRFRNERSLYGFRFADVSLQFPDYDYQEVECTILLDTLQAESPALTHEQQEQLFNAVWEDYPDITVRRDRMKRLREDIYYNALQLKYAYAVTCHKAQGGQWEHVYIDQGYITEDMLTPDYYRWLYTAITRATDKVFLINWKVKE